MTSIAVDLARFAIGEQLTRMPARAEAAVRMGMVDCIGVLIAGASEEPVDILSRMSADAGGGGAPLLPGGRLVSTADAALVNGVAAHVLDYDDVANSGHPSAVLVPAVLAQGWASEAGGAALMQSYAAGYEVWAQLNALGLEQLHGRGFHPTAILGAPAAAAACARLRGLDVRQTTHAIAIGASLAAGLVSNFGTMTKSLHSGRAAQAGVFAAALAAEGFTASPDAIEHSAGFLAAFGGAGRSAPAPELEIGKKWWLESAGPNIKRYPVCYAAHRSIDAMLDLVHADGLDHQQVKEIHVRIGAMQLLMLRNRKPKTALEAKFSIEFALASALVAGRVGLAELADEFVGRADVVSVMEKVRCTTTDEILTGGIPFAPEDRLRVVLLSGETLEHPPVARAKGDWSNPLSEPEFREKFVDCASRALAAAEARNLFDQLWNLSKVRSIRELGLFANDKDNRERSLRSAER